MTDGQSRSAKGGSDVAGSGDLGSPGLPEGPGQSADQQTFRWFAQPYAFMAECAKRYGDCFTIELNGTGKHVFFSHPDAVRQIFTGGWDHLHAGVGNGVWLSFMGPHSLLLVDGERHLHDRKMMLPAFHHHRLLRIADTMAEVTRRAVSRWEVGQTRVMLTDMLDVSLEIIVRVVLGLADERVESAKGLFRALLEVSEFGLGSIRESHDDVPSNPWRRYREIAAEVDDLLLGEIAQRRGDATIRDDVLSVLMQARGQDGAPVSDAWLRDELVTLVLAGHETTATSLAWAFYWILKDASILLRLDDSLRGGQVAWKNEYLEAVCKETLRICPTIPMVSRFVAAPATIGGVALPKGVNVSAAIYLTHHREDVWGDPENFRPQRFMERTFTPYEYLPFGGGVRRCIGSDFAMLEMKVVLATVLRSAVLELTERGAVRPARRNVTMAPGGGTRVRVLSFRDLGEGETDNG